MQISHLKLAESKHQKAEEKVEELQDLSNLMTFATRLEEGDLLECA